MDVAAMMCDDDVVYVGSQTGPIAKEVFCLLCAQQLGFGFSRISPFVPQNPSSKNAGSSRRLRANGMTEDALTHQQLHCGSLALPTRTTKLIREPFGHTIDSSVKLIVVISSPCVNAIIW